MKPGSGKIADNLRANSNLASNEYFMPIMGLIFFRHATNRFAELDHFWEKEQTKADVEVFIMDEIFSRLPSPPFTADEKKLVAENVYSYVFQQAMRGDFHA
ncbi:hypothetical protein [Bradyrhizobium zhanjiangense]|nr:hypothetical protein [Bradyrhizobium zhanjiangense]